ncbi:MAG: zinc-binding dehydrogenase [Planctomycetota bacterium]|jgi:NADPH:quinone reductase-like Zn-dependent oxidoreductase|nr:zinc-binding dehydrogenase [Planctomycetota bacterium]
MKTILIHEHGGPEVLQISEIPTPEPGPGQVRVRMHASAINHLDLWIRKGIPGHPSPLPMILGSDGSGVVDKLGPGVTHFSPGDPVVISPGLSCGSCSACLSGKDHLCPDYGILGETCDGTYAQFSVVPASNLIPKPDFMTHTDSASISLVFLTAWEMLVERSGIQPGDCVLIHAAGSGIGIAAVQIACLYGATVIATAGSEPKLTKARELGAVHTVNYSTPDWVSKVREITGRNGVDIVFEHVGASTWPGSMKILGRGGRVVTCGVTTGYAVNLDLRHLFFKNLSVLGSTMGSKGSLLHIWKLIRQRKLHPVVDRVFPLSQAQEAHKHVSNRQQFGKVVLEMDL